MIQKLTKFKTTDNIELTGVLYSPINESKKIIIHVHGLAGNFYENSFIDFQAKTYVKNGYTYFVFNNRGNGNFTDLIKKENNIVSFINGGASFELFEDSYLDIDSAIKHALNLGYEEIILQGHSYGCNKVINYYAKNKLKNIKSIILLAPCDIYAELKISDPKFDDYIEVCKEKLANGNDEEVVLNNLISSVAFSAKTVVNDFQENSSADIFRYRNSDYTDKQLNNIDLPVLVQIGSDDSASLTADKNDVIKYLNNNLKNLKLLFIENANHGYINKEQKMSDNCIKFLAKN